MNNEDEDNPFTNKSQAALVVSVGLLALISGLFPVFFFTLGAMAIYLIVRALFKKKK